MGNMRQYGVIVGMHGDILDVAPVYPLMPGIKCYTDSGAKRDRDKDNLHLRGCPPPFTEFYEDLRPHGFYGAYVYANMDDPKKVPVRGFGRAVAVDDGIPISEDMLAEILEHPWPEQFELEKSPMTDRHLFTENFFGTDQFSESGVSEPDFP